MLFEPEYFDILGIFVFIFLSGLAFRSLSSQKPIPLWGVWAILIIGLAGLIVDGTIVYIRFLT